MNQTTNPILPPLTVECSYPTLFKAYPLGLGDVSKINCLKTFTIKHNRSHGKHVKRNNWDYWTQKDEDKGKYACNNCLIVFYQEHKYFFWDSVRDKKKKQLLGNYVRACVNNCKRRRKVFCVGGTGGCGCQTACCYGCKCCMKKSQKIKELEKKLNKKVNSF